MNCLAKVKNYGIDIKIAQIFYSNCILVFNSPVDLCFELNQSIGENLPSQARLRIIANVYRQNLYSIYV